MAWPHWAPNADELCHGILHGSVIGPQLQIYLGPVNLLIGYGPPGVIHSLLKRIGADSLIYE